MRAQLTGRGSRRRRHGSGPTLPERRRCPGPVPHSPHHARPLPPIGNNDAQPHRCSSDAPFRPDLPSFGRYPPVGPRSHRRSRATWLGSTSKAKRIDQQDRPAVKILVETRPIHIAQRVALHEPRKYSTYLNLCRADVQTGPPTRDHTIYQGTCRRRVLSLVYTA
jgi:hypothetical protein